jgi:GNAT superfamily N-acetyltransferase
MRIGLADSEELDTAVGLLLLQFAEHEIALGRDELSAAVEGLLIDGERGAVLLAYDPHPIGIGVLAYTWTLEHGGRVGWLDELFVVPERRCRGIGLALLRRALEVARSAGCRAVDLEVDAAHVRAQRLYEREGFHSLHRSRWAKRLT